MRSVVMGSSPLARSNQARREATAIATTAATEVTARVGSGGGRIMDLLWGAGTPKVAGGPRRRQGVWYRPCMGVGPDRATLPPGSPMSELRPIFESLRESSDAVVDRWCDRVQVQPWLDLPPDLTLDHIPELLDAMAGALLGEPSTEEGRRVAVRMAMKHGSDRRNHGFDDEVLHHEHHLLRASIWDVIRERWGHDQVCFDAIARVDVVTTLTTSASLHGYHQVEPDARADTVTRLAAEEPWPAAV